MSDIGLQRAQEKMAAAGAPQAIDVFSHYYRHRGGVTGVILRTRSHR
jgi:hypothetical protein